MLPLTFVSSDTVDKASAAPLAVLDTLAPAPEIRVDVELALTLEGGAIRGILVEVLARERRRVDRERRVGFEHGAPLACSRSRREGVALAGQAGTPA